ncbi:hypothetical protein ACSAZL_12375 [Methanosarcina sp. T3]
MVRKEVPSVDLSFGVRFERYLSSDVTVRNKCSMRFSEPIFTAETS